MAPTTRRTEPATARASGPRRRQWLPPQHGAWAMLVVPFVAGMLPSWGGRASWWHVPLLVAWLAAYLWSYFALLAVKTKRWSRYVEQLRAYGVVAAVAGIGVLVARPGLLRLAPAFAVLFAVNLVYAVRKDDRALVNGLASVAQACLMTPAVAIVAGVPARDVVGPAVACFLYFAGTVLYVKTMIRERGERAYLSASIGVHAVALPLATACSVWLFVPFTAYLLRAVHLPRRRISVVRVGVIEVFCSIALLAALALPVVGFVR